MQYRRFGKTEFQIPVVSCGGMRYQQSWKDSDPVSDESQANLEACIRRALEVGVNHIETARGYGTSEYQLGKILPTLPRDKMLVQTKVEAYESVEKFVDTFEKSMSLLKLDYVDIFSVHGINTMQELEWAMPCLDKAEEWKKQGRIRDIGFSTHAPTHVIQKAIETERFEHVNLHWYYIFQDNWSCIEACAQRDMGVFIISPNDKGGKLYLELPKLRGLCSPLTPMQFNDLYCLARPEVHTLSLGAAKPSDFDEHIAGLQHYEQAAQAVESIDRRLREEMERVLGSEWCRRWWAGLPEFVAVPGEVNVVEILRIWTYAKPLELTEWAKFRYNMLGNADHWFPGEHVEKLDWSRLNEVIRRSPFADRLAGILREAHDLFHDAPVKRLSQS
jgi:hypothetical protein